MQYVNSLTAVPVVGVDESSIQVVVTLGNNVIKVFNINWRVAPTSKLTEKEISQIKTFMEAGQPDFSKVYVVEYGVWN